MNAKLPSTLEFALTIAKTGYRVFPLAINGKEPALSGDDNKWKASWKAVATTDPDKIRQLWTDPVFETEIDYNIGVVLDSNTLVVDVDIRDGKQGAQSLATFEKNHGALPPTGGTTTATGGAHLFYSVRGNSGAFPAKLAPGIDLKGEGGYVVGPGSTIDGKMYLPRPGKRADAPSSIQQLANSTRQPATKSQTPNKPSDVELDIPQNVERAKDWLINRAPEAIEGAGGDEATYKAAAGVKDYAISQEKCVELMDAYWNETKAHPPWDLNDLERKVANAYSYGQNAVGVKSAEAEFPAAPTNGATPAEWEDPTNVFEQRSLPGDYAPGTAPSYVEAFAADRARRLGVDVGSMAAATITVLGALVPAATNLHMRQNSNSWSVKSVPWTAVIGDPGTAKSPTLNAAMTFACAVERQWREQFAREMQKYELSQPAAAKDKRNKHATARNSEPKEGTPPNATSGDPFVGADDILVLPPSEPKLRRKIVHDATTEALGGVLAGAPESAPVLLHCDELTGLIGSLDAYRSRGGKDRPFFLAAKDGGGYSIDRASSGTKLVASLAVSILGGIQDDKLGKIAKTLTDDGFWQRFAPVIMRKTGRGEDIPDDCVLDKSIPRVAMALAELEGKDYRLSPEASLELSALHDFVDAECRRFDRSASLKTWMNKMPNEFGRYCLAFHLIEWAAGSGPMLDLEPHPLIPRSVAATARRYVQEFLHSHAVYVYETVMAKGQDDDLAQWVAGYILVHESPKLTERDIGRACRALRGAENKGKLKSVMATLTLHDWVKLTNGTLGHWKVNPAVHDGRFQAIKEMETSRRLAVRNDIAATAAARRSANKDRP